jgi:hypothetical protein
MKTYTTKAYAEAFAKLTEEELRSGKLEHETRCICNESGTTQVNLTNDEAEEYITLIGLGIQDDADVWTDTALEHLTHWLVDEAMMAHPSSLGKPTPSKVSQLAEVWDGGDGNGFVLLDGIHYRVDEPVGTAGQFYAVLGDQYAQRDHGFEKALQEVQLLELVPELLAALKEVLLHTEENSDLRFSVLLDKKAIDIVKAAIAKATAITHPTE